MSSPAAEHGLQQIPIAARQHARQNGSRGVHVRHHIHFPGPQPIAIGRARVAPHAHAGVGTKQIDLSEFLEDGVHQHLNVGFAGNVRANVPAFDFDRGAARGLLIEIRHHHRFGAFGGESAGHCPADSMAASGDDYNLVLNPHGLGSSCPRIAVGFRPGSRQCVRRRFRLP